MKRLLLLMPLLVMLACSVQKRKYQKGFYIAGNHRADKIKKAGISATPHHTSVQAGKMEEHDAQLQVEASVSPRLSGKDVSVKGKTHWFQNPDSCDKILFRDGKEVAARVTEISPAEIRYRKCDMPDGPLFVSRKADIFMIRYANGQRETFEPEKPAAPPAKSGSAPGYHRYSNPANLHSDASLSLILGIIGLVTFIYGSIHAIVLGSRVLNFIKAHPGNYEGEAMARAGVILGIIKLAILFLYFILIVIGLSLFI